MDTIKKAMIGTAAATAMAVSATPAMAKGYDRDRGGISAGEIIAGAVVLGAIAAIASSDDDDRYDDDRYDDDRYDRYYRYDRYGRKYRHKRRISPRRAVRKCVRATERRAGYYGRANVTRIRDVDRTRYGYKVKGRVIVDNGYRRGTDRGKFTCYINGNRVSDVRFKNLRYRR
ncbi:hypothetical protein AB1K62_10065 [Parasphingorhabdus sp. JC815]|uniref:hypothetical protein n=1 Tax=Parasphingorhabdus sp. JC815 TaxID=3232140 RepID=UPI00345A9C9B